MYADAPVTSKVFWLVAGTQRLLIEKKEEEYYV